MGGKGIALALLLLGISGLFGCGATPSGGSQTTQQNLTLGNSTLNFGTVVAGANAALSDTLTNSSTTSATITSASSSNSSFTVTSALPINIAPGQSATLGIAFAPQSVGKPSGTVTLSSGAGQLQIAVSGTVVSAGSLSSSPASLSFGNVVLGKSQTQNVSITNSGGSAVTVTQASASSSVFTINGLTLPLSLSPGQSASFSVLFTPNAPGNVSGSIALGGTASLSVAQTSKGQSLNVSASVSMSGDGIPSGQLNLSPGSIDFGNVQVGKTQSQTATLTNSGGNAVTVSQAVAAGSGFSFSGLSLPATLAAGQSVNFSVTFAPKSSGAATGSVAFTSDATNPSLNLPMTGVGNVPGALTANPSSLSFGSVQVSNSKTLSETLSNSGGTTVTLSQATVSGAGFSISGLTTPTQLTAGQSLTFTVVFAPKSAGSASGTVTVTSNAPNPTLAVSLSGTGAASGQLAVSPASLSFGNVTVGATKNLTSTLTASGASVTVSSATSNSSEFSLSGLSLPTTLTAGQSATFTVIFAPKASGSTSATISFASNASNTPPTIAASGTGMAPVQHSVTLSWQASSSMIAGYNVYRGTNSGGPYSILNTALIQPTDYTDDAVAAGQTYYYVVTAVDTQDLESVHSNQATAVVPTP
jgi:hypothetical protein